MNSTQRRFSVSNVLVGAYSTALLLKVVLMQRCLALPLRGDAGRLLLAAKAKRIHCVQGVLIW